MEASCGHVPDTYERRGIGEVDEEGILVGDMRIKCYYITDKGEKIVFYLYISKFCCTFAADFD